ncbi:MAG: hypothetical protein ACTSRK_07010 [Promethearchaeota archaeon]
MDKLFLLICDADPRILTDVAFTYARNAIKQHWMEEVMVILWGPSQTTVVGTLELKAAVMDLIGTEGIQVVASEQSAEDYRVTDKLEKLGISLIPIGEKITSLLKEGWHQLTF